MQFSMDHAHRGMRLLALGILVLGCHRTSEPTAVQLNDAAPTTGVFVVGRDAAARIYSFVGDPWNSLGEGPSRVVFALWDDGFVIASSDIVRGGKQFVSGRCSAEQLHAAIEALEMNANVCRELAPKGVVTDEPFSALVVWDGARTSTYSSQHEFRSDVACASMRCPHRATEAWLDAHYRSKELFLELLRGCSERRDLDPKDVSVRWR